MTNQEKGKLGENLAVTFLKQKGYTILERNYRFKNTEIDIIVEYNETLCFIEVKLRKNYSFGYPESQIKAAQILAIKSAAEYYLSTLKQLPHFIRFDVIAIKFNESKKGYIIKHIQDVDF